MTHYGMKNTKVDPFPPFVYLYSSNTIILIHAYKTHLEDLAVYSVGVYLIVSNRLLFT